MSEKALKEGSYITIQSWMVRDLKLKGNQLLIYAVIHGFSQDGENHFTGSLAYLSAWTGTSKQGVINNLKALVEKGYIKKIENIVNGVKFCEYYATNLTEVFKKVDRGGQKSLPGYSKNLTGGGQKSLPNNINNKLEDNLEDKERKKVSKKKQSYDELVEGYTSNEDLQETLKAFIQMRAFIKKPLTAYALKLMLGKLTRLASNDNDKIAILNNSIEHNWQGIFELKQNTYQQNYTNQPTQEEPKKDPTKPKRPLPGDYAIPGGGFDLERYQKDADAYNAWLRKGRR